MSAMPASVNSGTQVMSAEPKTCGSMESVMCLALGVGGIGRPNGCRISAMAS